MGVSQERVLYKEGGCWAAGCWELGESRHHKRQGRTCFREDPAGLPHLSSSAPDEGWAPGMQPSL